MEYSQEKIHFLDLLIFVNDNGGLGTSVFRKDTDRNVILHAQSHHPRTMIDHIPYEQFVRLKHICSEDSDFVEKAREMKARFFQKGYKDHVTDTAISKSRALNREQ